jgi:threonine synthase
MGQVGLIDTPTTQMHLAQAEGCAPIVHAFEQGLDRVEPVRPETIARSLAIGNPAAGHYTLQVLGQTGGTADAVPEESITEGIKLLAETEGIFTEPAGGVVISSLKRLAERGVIGPNEVTVAFITGNGLKTQEVMEHIVDPVSSGPDYESFQSAFEGRDF